MATWVDGWVNLEGREGGLPCPKFSQQICDQILTANVREQRADTEGEMSRKCSFTVFKNIKILPALTTIAPK